MTVRLRCLHCEKQSKVETTVLDCGKKRCLADTHSGWVECPRCGWETRLVRYQDGTVVSTHSVASSGGTAGHA